MKAYYKFFIAKIRLIRPYKIKVLALRQRRPLKISADGTFLLPYRKKIAAAPYFWKKKNFKYTAKFKFSSVPVMRTSFDKRLNDWSIEIESKNSAWIRVKTLSLSVLIRFAYPFSLKIVRCLKKIVSWDNSKALFLVTKCNFKHRNYTYCEWHMI